MYDIGDLSDTSARDLSTCGVSQYICIAGQRDNKIRCYVWQHGTIEEEKAKEFIDLLNKGIRTIDHPMYEKNFECIKEIGLLASHEEFLSNNARQLEQKMRDLTQQYVKSSKSEKEKIENAYNSERDKFILPSKEKLKKLIPKYYKELIITK